MTIHESIDMSVAIGTLRLDNPVMTASGTFGYGDEYAPYCDLDGLGAIIVKGLSRHPRAGNPPPRIMETPSGLLNAVGLQNIGVEAFIREKLPMLRQYRCPVIANIYGETIDEYQEVAALLSEAEGVSALEVNISCPNVKRGGIAFGAQPDAAAEVTRRVKSSSALPVIVKLTPNVADIAEIARSVAQAGADALSLINTLTGMAIDIETRRSHLANLTGGLSGPAIRPIAVRMVWQAAQAVSIPVIGMGGIMTARDAIEFLIVGACAVQVGTANFIHPAVALDIIEGIRTYLSRHGHRSVKEIVGSLNQNDSSIAEGKAHA